MFCGKINLRGKVMLMQAGYLRFLDFEISIPCRLHRRFPFEPILFTHCDIKNYQTLNTCHQPNKRSKHKLQALQRKITNQSFFHDVRPRWSMWSPQPKSRIIHQKFDHAHPHFHKTRPLTIQLQMMMKLTNNPTEPDFSHELHKHAMVEMLTA